MHANCLNTTVIDSSFAPWLNQISAHHDMLYYGQGSCSALLIQLRTCPVQTPRGLSAQNRDNLIY
jgi:hypothetical protein